MKYKEEFSITFFNGSNNKVQPLLIQTNNKIEEGYITDEIKKQDFIVGGITLKLLSGKYPSARSYKISYFNPCSVAFFNVSFLTNLIQNQNKN